MKVFSPDKIVKPQVGLHFVYGDYLYFNSDESALTLKKKFGSSILTHKNEFLNILSRNPMYIEKAVSFTTWNQMLLEAREFMRLKGEMLQLFDSNEEFRHYLHKDAEALGRDVRQETERLFLIEEVLLYYLLTRGQATLRNEFVAGHEKWMLWCYPGKPLLSMLYIQQANPFGFSNPINKYEASIYDLEERKL
jgi:hypothetical protein